MCQKKKTMCQKQSVPQSCLQTGSRVLATNLEVVFSIQSVAIFLHFG